MMGMKARALSCNSATCVHTSDTMPSSRVLDRYQIGLVLHEAYDSTARDYSRLSTTCALRL